MGLAKTFTDLLFGRSVTEKEIDDILEESEYLYGYYGYQHPVEPKKPNEKKMCIFMSEDL